MRTVPQCLEEWAGRDPARPLFTFLNRAGDPISTQTYGGFHLRTNGLARLLADDVGVAVGEPVLLVYPPGPAMITAFIACVKAGAIPVPVSTPAAFGSAAARERLSLVCASAGATRALTDTGILATLASPRPGTTTSSAALPGAHLDSVEWIATDGRAEPLADFEDRSHEVLLLQYTSGSTQEPRGAIVSHGNVIANCEALLDHPPLVVSWLPHFHDMGLIGAYLFPLIRGGSAVHFSPADFLRRPFLWLEAIGRFGATVTAAPNFAFEYCLRPDKIPDHEIQRLDLTTLRIMMNAAESVGPDAMERFRARFAAAGLSPEALVAAYGLAENTLCATSGGRAHVRVSQRLLERNELRIVRGRASRHNTVALASCGRRIAGVDIRIVDPGEARETAAGEVGEIWIDGPSKALGYWKQPELTRDVFRARLQDDPSGAEFLRTGDMGFFYDGELYVCGRLKDMVTIHGANVYPTDVEAIIGQALGSPGTRVVAFGFGGPPQSDDGLVVLIEWRAGGKPPDLRALHREVRMRLPAPILTLACVGKRSFATTSSGKLSRHRCRDRWRRGAVPVVDRFDPPAQPKDRLDIVDYVRDLVDLAGGSPEMTVEEIGLDSVELVGLSLALERFLAAKVGLRWLSDDMFDLRTVQSITVGALQQIVEDVDAGRSDDHALSFAYRRAALSVAERDAAAMRGDTALPAQIRPTGGSAAPRRHGPGATLLTGATGFLGAYLLDALLRLSAQPVVAVVRAHGRDHARRRVAIALARARGGTGVDPVELDPRIEVLPGDIAAPRLGLSRHEWRELAERVGAVMHCGAEVDYVKSYAELRGPNVSSTRAIIELCCAGAPKTLHHISSTFVFGWTPAPRMFEDDFNRGMHGLDFGYTQSKWVAEQLVAEAGARGLDARIYRPAFVTASRHGHYVREDVLARVLSYMIRHGVSVDADNQLSILPVDVCAQNIVSLALLEHPGARVFHLTTDNYYTLQMACRCITERYGYEFQYVGIPDMVAHMNRFCGPHDTLYPLVAFFRSNSHKIESMRDKRYDNRNYRAARGRSTLVLPEPGLAQTVTWLVDFLRRERLIPPAPAHAGDRGAARTNGASPADGSAWFAAPRPVARSSQDQRPGALNLDQHLRRLGF